MSLNGDDPIRDLADDRRGIAGACADLEHLVARSDTGGVDRQRNDIWLADGLARLDR
jgi:hypothetical protein